jgi:hypothetical protein
VTASGIPQVGGPLWSASRRLPSAPSCRPEPCPLHSGGGSAPRHRGFPRSTFPRYRIAQSVQGFSPRFPSGLSVLCMHAAIAAKNSANIRQLFLHIHLIRALHTTECPLPSHMQHTSPRTPAIPRSAPVPRTKASGTVPSHQEHFGAHQTQTWAAQSVRDSAEQLPSLTTTPKAGSCPCQCGYTGGTKSSESVLGWYSELDTSHPMSWLHLGQYFV